MFCTNYYLFDSIKINKERNNNMTTRNELIHIENERFLQTYSRLPIVIENAKGCRITDKDGNTYLDFLGGIAVNVLGHSHPKILKAINEQAQRYLHLSNYFYQDAQIEFAEKLYSITKFPKIFLTNSGTESIEGALKLSRKWGSLNNKKEILAFSNGFHGRTYGALSLMDNPIYKNGMGPFLENIKIIPYNSIESLMENINLDVASVFIEFIQGEGGISSVSEDFVNLLIELRKQNNFLIVADEIQAGMGRTGKFFSFEHFGITPDIVTLSKGLGGGLPLGAILTQSHLANVWEKSQHGTTFGGNALSCAAGSVVLDEISGGLLHDIQENGNYLTKKLHDLKNKFPKLILEVRGLGLMQGLVLSFEAKKLVEILLQNKVISNATHTNILRIVPPLIISKNDIDEFISALNTSLVSF
jgi:acetylornithine aminotransferase